MTEPQIDVRPIGRVESSLRSRADAPKQGDEGAPDASQVVAPEVVAGIRDLGASDEVLVLTWLHQADRDTLDAIDGTPVVDIQPVLGPPGRR